MPVVGMSGLDGRSARRDAVGSGRRRQIPKGGPVTKKRIRYSKYPYVSLPLSPSLSVSLVLSLPLLIALCLSLSLYPYLATSI